jgi:hypothetical protein
MSLRSRARALQRATGMTYQEAVLRIRALGRRPAELARKMGWTLKQADAHLVERPQRSPINVRLVATTQATTLQGLSDELCRTSLARAACVVDRRGRWLAMSGIHPDAVLPLALVVHGWNRETDGVVFDSNGGIHVLTQSLAMGARLFVLFDDRSSYALVRWRAHAAVREMNRILGESTFFRPPPGGDSGSSAPAQISAFDGLFDRLGKLGSG